MTRVPQANPLESLATAGCLMQWWIAMKEYVQRQRDQDKLTPVAAMDVLWRYLGSCMESHRGMIISGQFRSTRVKQVRPPPPLATARASDRAARRPSRSSTRPLPAPWAT